MEVKGSAVNCIQKISSKIRDASLFKIIDKLCAILLIEDANTIDIFSLTLRMIIKDSKDEQAQGFIDILYPQLLKGLTEAKEEYRQKALLDTCSDMLRRFGLFILRSQSSNIDKEKLMAAIHNQLVRGSTAEVRTRASLCMGAFAVILTNKQLASLTHMLVD